MSINNRGLSKEFQERIINDLGIVECSDFHDGTCLYASFIRLLQLIPKSYKYYIPIHLIPFLIFKRKRVMQRPLKTISVAFYNYAKSVLFVSLYVAICKYALCKLKNIRHKVDGWNPALAASAACSALFLESEGRRQEIALFIFPKSLETAWRLLKREATQQISKDGNCSYSVLLWELLIISIIMTKQQLNLHTQLYSKIFGKRLIKLLVCICKTINILNLNKYIFNILKIYNIFIIQLKLSQYNPNWQPYQTI